MLRMFTPVAIVCDRTMIREAHALRGVLESFALQVDFHYFIQKRQILDFFAQPRNYAYTIIFCHGSGKTAEDMHLRLEVVDQESGDYDTPGDEGWDFVVVELTPAKIAEYVQNRDGHAVIHSVWFRKRTVSGSLSEIWLSLLHRAYSP